MADDHRLGTGLGGEIGDTVLAYLSSHPNAADTLDGIVTWWLPYQRYETGRARVERALEELVSRGLLRRDELPDGAVLYALTEAGRTSRRIH